MASRDSSSDVQTWHHGVVAKWWAEFNTDGPEIEFYRPYVETGQPALDLACGTGRLLIPYLRAGLDVDGCDVSADMVALCRERAAREGVSTDLRVQAMHELDMPRIYGAVLVCGAFGLGGDRARDEEALRRIYDHLEPSGILILDNEVPYNHHAWKYWTAEGRAELPEPWRDPGDRRLGSDGSEYALSVRTVDLDPLAQRLVSELRGYRWRDGELVEQDEHRLESTAYFTPELKALLERAGFSVRVTADYTDQEPTRDSVFVTFFARKPRP